MKEIVEFRFDYFDKCETIENCKVQILENSKTGKVSVGWMRGLRCGSCIYWQQGKCRNATGLYRYTHEYEFCNRAKSKLRMRGSEE